MTKIAIIGAGLSGLTLARRLQGQAEITVFEKSRGVSGRMSTRYAGEYEFDHGAQYFTQKDEAFRSFLAAEDLAGFAPSWPVDIHVLDARHPKDYSQFAQDKARYVSAPRMNALCKALARDLNICLKTQITVIEREQGDMWMLGTPEGERLGPFDWVISSAPAPQSRALMPEVFSGHAALSKVKIQGCFSLMLGFQTPLLLPFSAARISHSPIGWITVNSEKPGRKGGYSLLIQSTNDWSEEHMETDLEEAKEILLRHGSTLCERDLTSAEYISVHRWRYAATAQPLGSDYLMDDAHKLAACGDWCLGARIENAFTSAYALAKAVQARL